jgi:hypothetical protein
MPFMPALWVELNLAWISERRMWSRVIELLLLLAGSGAAWLVSGRLMDVIACIASTPVTGGTWIAGFEVSRLNADNS